MGRELREAIKVILVMAETKADTKEQKDAISVLRRAVSGSVPGDRE